VRAYVRAGLAGGAGLRSRGPAFARACVRAGLRSCGPAFVRAYVRAGLAGGAYG